MDDNREEREPGKISRRDFLIGAAGLAATTVVGGLAGCAAPTSAPTAPAPATAAPTAAAKAGGQVIHMSWGGVYEENLKKIFFDVFEKETGIKAVPISPMDLGKLRAGAKAGKVEMDSFDGSDVMVRARNEGLLTPIDYNLVGREGRSAFEMNEYGLGLWGTSNVLVYNTKKWPAGQGPSSWADFWDVKKFPGRRALYKHPVANLLFALMADGVPVDKIAYPLDVDRAFKSLDRIKSSITVWWEQGAQSQQLFKDGEVDLMMMWNGRATDLIKQGVPLYIVWNGGVLGFTQFMVTKGGPNTSGALKLAAYMGRPELQAQWAKAMGYGPVSAKAFDYVDKETAPTLSTYPANLKVQHIYDIDWWAANQDAINERFLSWLAAKS